MGLAMYVLTCPSPSVAGAVVTCRNPVWAFVGVAGLNKAEFVPVASAVITVLLIGAAFRYAIRMFLNR